MRYVFAIIALGVAVTIHELGHYFGARLFGLDVERFTVGFGPPLLSFKPSLTRFTLGAIPFGGFARIRGMNPHDPVHPEDWGSYSTRPAWQRMCVVFAGPLMGYVFSVLLLTVLYLSGTHVPVPMTIGQVEPGSAAARAQVRPGDVVVTVNGEQVFQWHDLVSRIDRTTRGGLEMGLLRQGEPFKIQVVPQSWRGIGRIGVSQQYIYKRHPPAEAFVGAAAQVHRFMGECQRSTWRVVSGKGLEQLNPVPIVNQTSDTAWTGLEAFLRVTATLSIILSLVQLLPLPSLDGGKLLFLLFELASRRRVPQGAETMAHVLGFLALLALVCLIALRAVVPWRTGASARPRPSVSSSFDGSTP
ncbi:MAG: M50 family metallopeptidase [Myxococcaceae bacterium]